MRRSQFPGNVVKMIQDDTKLQTIKGIKCLSVDDKLLVFGFEGAAPQGRSKKSLTDPLKLSGSGKTRTASIKKVIDGIPSVQRGMDFPDKSTYHARVTNGTLRVSLDPKVKP
jgi:hypothetical protein